MSDGLPALDAPPAPAFVAPDRELAKLPVRLRSEDITDFCRRHGVDWLALFGSVLRDDFDEESDVDFLVDFLPGRTPAWFGVALEEELAELVNRDVDLRTPREISLLFLRQVLRDARTIYRSGGTWKSDRPLSARDRR